MITYDVYSFDDDDIVQIEADTAYEAAEQYVEGLEPDGDMSDEYNFAVRYSTTDLWMPIVVTAEYELNVYAWGSAATMNKINKLAEKMRLL